MDPKSLRRRWKAKMESEDTTATEDTCKQTAKVETKRRTRMRRIKPYRRKSMILGKPQ